MARTDTLGNFLTDVADAIRAKKGTTDTIVASDFDTEIMNLPSGGSGKYAPRYVSFYKYGDSELTQEIEGLSLENMTSVANMFYSSAVTQLDLSSLDFSTITNFTYMCYSAKFLSTINFGNSVPKPITLDSMMHGCSNLTALDISHFDCSDTITIGYICNGNSNLKSVVLPSNLGENTTAVYMAYAFYGCVGLEEIDFSYLHCPASDMSRLFYKCINLKRVDLRNITNHFTPSVNYMFADCTSLEHIDIRNLDMSSHTSNYSTMLSNVPTTCEIIVKDDVNKEWFATNFPTYTNVKTAVEYEG